MVRVSLGTPILILRLEEIEREIGPQSLPNPGEGERI